MTGALSHLRVLDLSRVLAGPWATQNLADLGADVIKVERPGTGDDTRSWGPPWVEPGDGSAVRDSTYYAAANRGKRSVTVDFGTEDGQKIIRELARSSDILVENYKVGDLARRGLDYATLSKENPRLVYCSITGYGQTGPKADRPGYDIVFQAIGGMMSITGERDDLPGGGPQKVGVAIADVITGMYATIAILAAVNHREVSGTGQYIDISLIDSIIALGGNQVTGYFATGQAPGRYGNAHASLVPYQSFGTADGEFVVAAGNDGQFVRLCDAIGHPEFGADPRWSTASGRITNRDSLVPELARVFRQQPTAVWIGLLERAGLPCGEVKDYAQVFTDPHVVDRQVRVDIPRADGGTAATIASPLRLQGTPVDYPQAPPVLGEHTDAVLSEFLDAEQLAELRGRGVI
ncbi:CaiB/BaiF CoA transferase family protein [Cumulibacter manganitolerans]|uniref:CaiB/BaiF CoA transferase family protein n=1 Tax=Cumulibacter manganitolerans TaxID=1884992 RepID=UPI001295C61E|nr:CaiB/BaiF CoA-transferase family protein [Cumulibacter manganitolerans]